MWMGTRPETWTMKLRVFEETEGPKSEEHRGQIEHAVLFPL